MHGERVVPCGYVLCNLHIVYIVFTVQGLLVMGKPVP